MTVEKYYMINQDYIEIEGVHYDMAKKSEVNKETVEVTENKIELLKEVYYVDGSFYRTEAEAKLHNLKEKLYGMYLDRQGYKGAQRQSYLNQAKANKFYSSMVYIDDVIKSLGESGLLK